MFWRSLYKASSTAKHVALAATIVAIASSCAKAVDKAPVVPEPAQAPITTVEAVDPLRLCVGNKQIVSVSGTSEAEKTRTVEGIFSPTTIISKIEGPVTYCLRMKANEELGTWDAFLRIEVEDESGTTVLPYRGMEDAFYADVYWSDKDPTQRIVNAIFVDTQGIVEVYAKGSDVHALIGDITYHNFGTFSDSLNAALETALADSQDKTEAQKLGYNYFHPTNPILQFQNPEETWFDIFTTMLDEEGIKLGDINLDVLKSIAE